MEDFGLTLNEVRNKIRIYRTTYMQEKNKEATIANYVPRLSWYQDMKMSFKEGQVKSFAKSPMRRTELVRAVKKEKEHQINSDRVSPDMHFEFIENDMDMPEDNSNSIKAEQHSSVPTHIIIEPFEEDEEEEELQEEPQNNTRESNSFSKSSHVSDTKSKSTSLLSSNELFLQSLKSTLDNLPDEKNMRARIKIQEVLYTIMYEKP